MVKRVFGKVDGTDVILKQNGDRWTVPVPLDSDGEYVVEIMAEDEAGNISYVTKMLFVVNKTLIRSYVVPLSYYAVLQQPDKAAYLIGSIYTAALQRFYAVYLDNRTYTAKILKEA